MEVKRLELTSELVSKYGINNVYYNSEKIDIIFINKVGKEDVISIPILEYGSDSINKLDALVDGSMTPEAFTHLKSYLTQKLLPIWDQIYVAIGENINEKGNSNAKDKAIKIAFDTLKEDAKKLFTDEYGTPYIALMIDDHLQVFHVDSNSFKDWYRLLVYEKHGTILDSETINKLCSLARAYAASSKYGQQIKLSLRTASTVTNKHLEWIYDLTNKNWEFVKITSNGWHIAKNEIIFRRYSNQRSQVYPSREYDPKIFDKFMKLVNVRSDDHDTKLLLKCYIVSLFIPDIQKVVLMLHGSQGSAKSFLEELIKEVVDPSIIKTLVFPRDVNELIQQLSHNYVVFYDNISTIPYWISDQLCRATSGSGSSKRQLYTDDDDIILTFKRCVGFNGINLAATKADLLDRGLIVKLERILAKNQRKPTDIWTEFEEIRPQLLGFIFDILVKVLHWKNNGLQLNLDGLPRMSEFAEYGEIISRVMGNPDNSFINAYHRNIELQSEEVIESSHVAICIRYMMFEKYADKCNDYRNEWKGTPTALLTELQVIAEDVNVNIDIKTKYFPKSANALSRKLNEIAENLKSIGLQIEWSKENKKRFITIRKISSPSSPSSPTEYQTQN